MNDTTHVLQSGTPLGRLVKLAWPMILANLLQQLYSLCDALIVSRYVGLQGLAAVGASASLLVLLTALFIGLGLGLNVALSARLGARDQKGYRLDLQHGFWLLLLLGALIELFSFVAEPLLLALLRLDPLILSATQTYLRILFSSLIFVALFNYLTAVLRAQGNTRTPLMALLGAALINLVLDFLFVAKWQAGVAGAAYATWIAQLFSLFFLALKTAQQLPEIRSAWHWPRPFRWDLLKRLASLSSLAALQQGVMNLGILMIQGLVNSYGYSVAAVFTAGVRIDAFAYMPVQDFGNAFATLVAYHRGQGETAVLKRTMRVAFGLSSVFALFLSLVVVSLAPWLLKTFFASLSPESLAIGVGYLRIEASFYIGIAWLFLWYGYYRAMDQVGWSLILTVLSLGLRVAIAYLASPVWGLKAIWWAIPIGWFVADTVAFFVYLRQRSHQQRSHQRDPRCNKKAG